jgi:hypothetical protein
VREHLFSAQTPDDIVESCAASVQSEAVRASLIDPLIRRVKCKRVNTVAERIHTWLQSRDVG